VVLLLVAAVVVDFLATRFALEAEALVIHSGSWKRVTRSIPYARIQGVSTSQSLAQRLLGVGTLRVDTGAGGVAAEALLASLRWREVQQLRETLLRARDHGGLTAVPMADTVADAAASSAAPVAAIRAPSSEVAVTLATLDDEELLLAGATSMQLLVILGAAVGLVERLGDEWVSLVFSDRVRGVAAQLTTGGGAGLLLALGVVVGLSVLAVLWLGVVLATWVRYRGFRLSRVGNALVREYGWLHRRTASTPMARVQAVTLHETPPRRIARRVEVRLKSAGGMAVPTPGDEPDVPVLLPIVRAAVATDAVSHVFPDAHVAVMAAAPVPGWQRASPRSWVRTGVERSAVLAAVLAPLAVLFGSGVWQLLWGLPLLWALTPLAWRVRGVGVTGGYLVVREGWLMRITWVVPVAKLQQVQLRQGPLQRGLRLATVRFTTAGLGGVADVVDLPVADARLLVEDLMARLPALRRRRVAPPAHLLAPVSADVS
jgi:putative membrane protein